MADVMVLEMILPPPSPSPSSLVTIDEEDDALVFRDCNNSESMSTQAVIDNFQNEVDEIENVSSSVVVVTGDKEEKNVIQKLLAESTAAIAALNSLTIEEQQNQEEDQQPQQHELVSTPQMTTTEKNVPQRQQQLQQSQIPRQTALPGISTILPSLFLCSAAAARVNILEHLKINLVINVAPELIVDTPLPHPKPIYLRISALDKGNVDLKRFFDETCDLMEDVRQSGGRTLIHCVAGVSRSAAICIAYLMKYGKMSLKDAYKHVKWARPQIRPNCGFFRQLIAYELELTGVQTVDFVYVESIGQEVPDVYEPEYKAMEQFYQRHRHRHVRSRD